jgi:hypothetical protein
MRLFIETKKGLRVKIFGNVGLISCGRTRLVSIAAVSNQLSVIQEDSASVRVTCHQAPAAQRSDFP